ncbi:MULTISPECIES: hypothetical protein [Rhodobacterales]|uniref:Uncharacterized protein n=1 Tax=Pelagivirga sediminicola TaxID=2170575 RepID=A0A2T7G2S1_9RHOB|nr:MULTISPECIES: hypothetical protein [Rhodobacterales]MCQ0090223.1 hypothetical protein [Roseovarius sp. M141]PVA08719.1 hypothetical protein DC366_17790 [Pelagivirga sediminicola]
MNHLFDIKIPFWRFARNTLIVSCLSLLPLLLLYILLSPGFAGMLLDNRMALSRFLRQVVTNGLPVVFAVNYLSFFLYAVMKDGQRWTNVHGRLSAYPADFGNLRWPQAVRARAQPARMAR